MKPTQPSSPAFGRFRIAPTVSCMATVVFETGCSRAPSFNVLGSFFPSWMLCGVVGILLAIGARMLFVRANFEKELSPLILVYPSLAAFFTFATWLLFFS